MEEEKIAINDSIYAAIARKAIAFGETERLLAILQKVLDRSTKPEECLIDGIIKASGEMKGHSKLINFILDIFLKYKINNVNHYKLLDLLETMIRNNAHEELIKYLEIHEKLYCQEVLSMGSLLKMLTVSNHKKNEENLFLEQIEKTWQYILHNHTPNPPLEFWIARFHAYLSSFEWEKIFSVMEEMEENSNLHFIFEKYFLETIKIEYLDYLDRALYVLQSRESEGKTVNIILSFFFFFFT